MWEASERDCYGSSWVCAPWYWCCWRCTSALAGNWCRWWPNTASSWRTKLASNSAYRCGIAELTGSWRGFEPLVVARDIQVGDGEQSLRLARVRLAPDLLGSLLARQVRIGSLELEGLKLTLREGEGWPVEPGWPAAQ